MAVMSIVAIAGLALSAASMGVSYSGALNPSQPNLGAASKQMAQLQAELLPFINAEQAAAQEGGQINETFFTPAQQKQQQQLNQTIASTQAQIAQAQKSGNTAEVSRLQNELAGAQRQLSQIHGTPISGNFAGMSTADIQGMIQNQLAKGKLAIQQQFDPQFIQAALAQEKLANPQGVEARQMEQNLIQQQINNPPVSPVANAMEKQIEGRVAAGSGLTPEEEQMLASTVAQASGARGNAPATGFERDLTTGLAGTQRELANAGAGQSFLASGETPEDISYRAQQQNMENLANFIAGRTPQSQFASLTNAAQGATPMADQSSLSRLPTNAQQLGSSGALNNYQAQFNNSSPWLAGTSALLGGLNVAGSAGFKPFGGG